MDFKMIDTRTVPTIQVTTAHKKLVLHSKYDPIREANSWCDKEVNNVNHNEEIVVIGLGAGYHILQLATLYPNQKINIIEFNNQFFQWFKKSAFYQPLKDNKNISLKSVDQFSAVERNEIFSSVSISNLLIHKSGIDLLPEGFQGVEEALKDIIMQKNSLKKQLGNLKTNFNKNIALNDPGIQKYKNVYQGKPMILVSAGPSLQKQLPLLKQISEEKKFVIGAVGTAVKPLIQANITPDFFMIIDPNEGTFGQLTDINLPETPLYYLSTAYHETVLLHRGPKYIVFQEEFFDAEKIANQKNEPLIKTGGSVATALLDLMVYFGGTSIGLIGQDLAYTGGKTHTSGSHRERSIVGVQKTLNYDRTGEIETAHNLNLYRKWLERYVSQHPTIHFYNCTEGGAYIENWKHIRFETFYEKYVK